MKKRDFLSAVEHEVRMLKEHANKSELKKLNFDNLDPRKMDNCIYGQMTGSCASKRAKKLMDKSCIIVTNGKLGGCNDLIDKKYSDIKRFINGQNTGQGWYDQGGDDGSFLRSGSRDFKYLSALEAYICLNGAKNKHIIDFIRGEVEVLSL